MRAAVCHTAKLGALPVKVRERERVVRSHRTILFGLMWRAAHVQFDAQRFTDIRGNVVGIARDGKLQRALAASNAIFRFHLNGQRQWTVDRSLVAQEIQIFASEHHKAVRVVFAPRIYIKETPKKKNKI